MTLDFDQINVGDFIVVLGHSFSGPSPATCERVERKTKTLLITDAGTRIGKSGWTPGKDAWQYHKHAVPYDDHGKRLINSYRQHLKKGKLAQKLHDVKWMQLSIEQLEAITESVKATGVEL